MATCGESSHISSDLDPLLGCVYRTTAVAAASIKQTEEAADWEMNWQLTIIGTSEK
jgi:hypothetical protein